MAVASFWKNVARLLTVRATPAADDSPPSVQAFPPFLRLPLPHERTADFHRDAFFIVLEGTSILPGIRKVLWEDVSDCIDSDPRRTEKRFYQSLGDLDWEWSVLEQWKAFFMEQNTVPHTWTYLFPILERISGDALFGPFTAKDLRHALDCNAIAIPEKTLKAGLLDMALAHLTLNQLIAAAPERWEKVRAWQRSPRCDLLAHTIAMYAYKLRDHYQRGCVTSPSKYLCVAAKCPVEEHFAALWNKGKIQGLPPFFPGDRNTIRKRLRGE